MSDIFDHLTEDRTSLYPICVEFSLPDAGWIWLKIKPLHELYGVSCTYIWDPFPHMLAWLGEIADGCDAATWQVNEEGHSSRLQFYGGAGCIDDRAEYLLHIQTHHDGIYRVRGVKVERRQLVEAFYRSFRAMAESPDYVPREWEAHPQFELLDEMDDEEYTIEYNKFPYGGQNLRELTSPSIEAYLAAGSTGDQQTS